MGFSQTIIEGNLGGAPELRFTPSGTAVCNFSIATNEEWIDQKSGEKQKRTEWHRVVAWRKTAENCGKFLNKGDGALIVGQNRTREWTDKEGNTRWTTEVVARNVQFLGKAGGAGRQDKQPGFIQPGDEDAPGASSASSNAEEPIPVPDDDIPF